MVTAAVEPEIVAAITKSSSRSCSSLPRTTRASPPQLTIERIMVIAR